MKFIYNLELLHSVEIYILNIDYSKLAKRSIISNNDFKIPCTFPNCINSWHLSLLFPLFSSLLFICMKLLMFMHTKIPTFFILIHTEIQDTVKLSAFSSHS